jgi:hypothetical protein
VAIGIKIHPHGKDLNHTGCPGPFDRTGYLFDFTQMGMSVDHKSVSSRLFALS